MPMFGKVTPEKAIQFAITLGRFGGCLPPPASAKNLKITCYKIYWMMSLCMMLSFSLPIMYDMYLNGKNINSIVLNGAELCPLFTGKLKMLVCKYNERKLQDCFSEVERFLKTATRRERELLQNYVDRCVDFHHFMLFCIVSTILGFSGSPIYLPQPYPTHASYPFEVNTKMLKNFLRGFQVVAIIQTANLVAVDFVFSVLVWFTAARFELLTKELKEASNAKQLRICIRKHQNLLQLAEDVNSVTRFVAYGVGLSTTVGTIFGGIQLVRDVSTLVKARFVSFVMVGTLEILVYCWPAENLMGYSREVGFSIYSSRWIDQSPEMARLIFIMVERSKKPAIISIGDFLPMLSLNFYGSFLSTSFSYFTTLRATTTSSDS